MKKHLKRALEKLVEERLQRSDESVLHWKCLVGKELSVAVAAADLLLGIRYSSRIVDGNRTSGRSCSTCRLIEIHLVFFGCLCFFILRIAAVTNVQLRGWLEILRCAVHDVTSSCGQIFQYVDGRRVFPMNMLDLVRSSERSDKILSPQLKPTLSSCSTPSSARKRRRPRWLCPNQSQGLALSKRVFLR